ncbi:MAG: hypothetical protein KF754_16085 [Planctomycetes bacterium]|nr:hypothetical protein [Planctomycetota bacterium]
MRQGRLGWLLALMVVLILLRWWVPPEEGANKGPSIVPAVVRAAGTATAASAPPAAPLMPVARGEVQDLPGNAFPVRVIRQLPPPPPPPPVKVVAFVGPPAPPPPPPPPPPPAMQVIGTWDDGVAPGVFISTAQGTVLARNGTVLLAEYRVTGISTQQISITHTVTKNVWQLPVPRAMAKR